MIQNGEILDGMYQIICEIGRGGTGIIYLAEHLRLKKKVVVKKIKDHFAGQINGRAEVDILKRLHHSYLPQVYDFLAVGTSIYTVMEYVEGQDLQRYMDQGYRFDEQTLRQWMFQLCEVIEYLHTQNPPILHSDIKPSNIMITTQGTVCLIDFNISLDGEAATDVQGVSPWFAAPEQYQKAMDVLGGRQNAYVLDGRMDIYSLGAVFYYMITGRRPSPEKEFPQDICSLEIPYSDGFRALIAKAMKWKPSARFQTAGQMKKVLQNISKMDPLYRRYTRLQVAAGFAWLIGILAGALLLYYGSWQNGAEKWQQAYRQLYLSAESQNDEEAISQGTEILNAYTYKGYLKKHEDRKAEVLHVLGESYFRLQKFDEAADYYREAWEMMPEEGKYCRDYVAALVYDGKISKARQVMKAADGMKNMSGAEKIQIQAEISWGSGAYEDTLKELRKLTEGGFADADILQQGYLLMASVYESQEEYEKSVAALEQAKQVKSSKEVLRRLGQSAVKAASLESRQVSKQAYLEQAYNCYQNLAGSRNPSYEDRLNLALVERARGNYENSNRALKELDRDNGKEYAIPMWMCYNYLDLAKERGSYDGILEDLKFRFEDSRHRYSDMGQQDADMEELTAIMKELEE